MANFNVSINGKKYQFDVDPDTPLLWVLRDHAQLVGTKYGCGIAQCGACTVHIDGKAVRSCVYPASAVDASNTANRLSNIFMASFPPAPGAERTSLARSPR